MNILWTAIVEGAKKHGIVFLVLLALIVYFHNQTEKLEKKFDLCNQQVIQMYESHNLQLIEVVERNTRVLEKLVGND